MLSGAVMMLAGYLGQTESWALAGLIAIPGGLVILAAFALSRRDRAESREAPASGSSPVAPASAAVTLFSGGVMVFAGYAASVWGWCAAATLATLGGLMVGAAFALDQRDRGQPAFLRPAGD
jgi:putative Mn2+ efflux pump MntP